MQNSHRASCCSFPKANIPYLRGIIKAKLSDLDGRTPDTSLGVRRSPALALVFFFFFLLYLSWVIQLGY